MSHKEIKDTLNTINLISKIALQVGTALGILITIIYCGVIEYYPAGLTIGDVLFFVAASLSFSFSYTLVVLTLFCAGITLSPILRWVQCGFLSIKAIRKKLKYKNGEPFMLNFPELGLDKFGFVIIGLIVFLLIVTVYYKDFDKALGLTFAVILMSFLYGCWCTKPNNSNNEKTEFKVKVWLAIIITLVPLIVTKSQGNMLNQAMSVIGVRSDSVEIQLPEKYVFFLSQYKVEKNYIANNNEGIYSNSKILFRGIGEYTVIEIKGFKLIVPTKEILVGKQMLTKP